jgi:hypothetical protein
LFPLFVSHDFFCNAQLVVQVWDFDRFSGDDLLGTVRVPMTEAFRVVPDRVSSASDARLASQFSFCS